jgi:Zn-dependent protease with chaperone function
MEQKINYFDQIAKNRLRSLLLLLFSFIVYLVASYTFFYFLLAEFGTYGLIGFFTNVHVVPNFSLQSFADLGSALNRGILSFSFAVVALYAVYAYLSASRNILNATRSQEADRGKYKQLYDIIEGLAAASQIPMPRVYIADDSEPNAFATGISQRRAAISVTKGLLSNMDKREITGVLAHEVSHIANHDMQLMTMAIALSGAMGIIRVVEKVVVALETAVVSIVVSLAYAAAMMVALFMQWIMSMLIGIGAGVYGVGTIAGIADGYSLGYAFSQAPNTVVASSSVLAAAVIAGIAVFLITEAVILKILRVPGVVFEKFGREKHGFEILAILLFSPIIFVIAAISTLFIIIVNFSISRKREYMADANGSRITRDPAGLANALKKIKAYEKMSAADYARKVKRITYLYDRMAEASEKNDEAGYNSARDEYRQLYAYLTDSGGGSQSPKDGMLLDRFFAGYGSMLISSIYFNAKQERKPFLSDLFSTHPDIDERIRILEGMY